MLRRILLLLAACLALAGCGRGVDAEQARICRQAIPALNADGANFRLSEPRPGPGRNEVLIQYEVGTPRGTRRRTITCRFAGTGFAAGKARLVGITTERGALSDASVYFLQRFYLETPEAAASDPERRAGAARVLQLPSPLAYGLQQALAALPMAAIYGLLAASYALIFGLVRRIMLGFGEFAVLGGMAATLTIALSVAGGVVTPLPGLLSGLVVAVMAGALHGLVAGRLAVVPLLRLKGQQIVIVTVGLSIALAEYLRLAQGESGRWVPPVWNATLGIAGTRDFLVTVTPMSLLVTATGALAAGLLIILLARTHFGRAWRAYADDPVAAALFGIDGRVLFSLTFALATGLAALAGFLMVAQYGGVGFSGGLALGLKALVAAVVGGIGSVAGALAGGLVIAAVEAAWSAALPIELRDIAVYCLLVLFLVLRPGGLFGERHLVPREI
ncbi:branched-chain amino acid ABC transporter permease [Chelatococcus daeguensis]|uniref:branched-chain amino acid ABC transporter permease n=1 Tax=Chelatococcus daeguensis TaxID=444444 RepID=UPI0007AB9736|nr:branched-chain amino acid ABC transporter permease [Chelatococcus daeguensis]KZE35878.1 hypothetical protein AVW15_13175 [Chelatococcus daeguensis]MBM3085189.1 branched-chain amino acid ABC transporter permease [Chelatococcus daeguensis]